MNTPNHPTERGGLLTRGKRLRALYHEASQRLDPDTCARLRVARHDALLAALKPVHPASLLNRWLIPTGALAAMLATLMLWHPRPMPLVLNAPTASRSTSDSNRIDNELPPDAAQSDPQLYQDLDFYGWLAANDSPSINH